MQLKVAMPMPPLDGKRRADQLKLPITMIATITAIITVITMINITIIFL